MESIEDIIGHNPIPVISAEEKIRRGEALRKREMEIFDSLPKECRDKINYSDTPIVPSFYRLRFYGE